MENKKIFTRRLWAEVNMDSIKHNFEQIRAKLESDTKLCCVIKADGYGHGAVEIAKLYSKLGADFFAVSNLDEALELRNAEIKEPILILGYTPANRVDDIAKYDISQAVYSKEYADMLKDEAEKAGVRCKIHIKLDTGMSRIGFMCQEFPRDNNSILEIKEACDNECFIKEGIFTHFAVADSGDLGKEFTDKQSKCFLHTVDELKKLGVEFEIKHMSNSGAVIDYKDVHFDMVRAGIILYGYYPSDMIKGSLDLRPAMRLKTVISNVKTVKKGTTIGYGRTFTADKDMKIATVPVGYADGFIRSYAKDGYMYVWDTTKKRGFKAKIVGRICMDQTMLDVTDFDDAQIGNVVVVFGDGKKGEPTAEDVASWGDTISYEVLCAVSKRVPRLYRTNWITGNVVYKL